MNDPMVLGSLIGAGAVGAIVVACRWISRPWFRRTDSAENPTDPPIGR